MLLILLTSALFIASRFFDFTTSNRAIYYAEEEANPIFRDRYHVFSPTKYLAINGALFAAVLVASFFQPYCSLIFLPFAAGAFIAAYLNWNKGRKK